MAEKKIKELSLTHSSLEEFKNNLKDYSGLQELMVYLDGMPTFPEEIFTLTSLKKLRIAGKYSSLSELIGDLANLETLHIEFNGLESLPESIGKLTKLQSLKINFNKFTNLPESFGKLVNLRELRMDDNKKFTEFPRSFSRLKNLTTLEMQQSGTPYIPDYFLNFKKLKAFTLDEEQAYEFSPELAQQMILQGCKISSYVSRRDMGGDSELVLEELDQSKIDLWCHGGLSKHLDRVSRSSRPYKVANLATILDIPDEEIMDRIEQWKKDYDLRVESDEIFFRVDSVTFTRDIMTRLGLDI